MASDRGLAQAWEAPPLSLGIQTSGWGSALAKVLGGRNKTG